MGASQPGLSAAELEARIASARDRIGRWALSSSILLQPTTLGAEMLGILAEAARADRGSLMLINPITGRLRLMAAIGIPHVVVDRDLPPAHRRISDWVCREGRPLILNGTVEDQRFESSAASDGIRSAMSIPIPGGVGAMGVVNLARLRPNSVFDEGELESMSDLVRQMSLVLAPLLEHRLVGLGRRRRGGARPDSQGGAALIRTRCHQIGVAHTTSAVSAGDVFEHVVHADGSLTVMLADVTGSGADALEAGSLLRGMFVVLARTTRSPAGIARTLNVEICSRLGERAPVSAWLACLAPNGVLSCCSAGCPSVLWVPFEGELRAIPSRGGILGLSANAEPEQQRIPLLPGDTVVALSDGILRATNAAGHEFGQERLEETVFDSRRKPPDALAAEICSAALSFSISPVPIDDLAAIAIRFTREG